MAESKSFCERVMDDVWMAEDERFVEVLEQAIQKLSRPKYPLAVRYDFWLEAQVKVFCDRIETELKKTEPAWLVDAMLGRG